MSDTKRLSAAAAEAHPGVTYEMFQARGWSDEQLRAAGWLDQATSPLTEIAALPTLDEAERKLRAANLHLVGLGQSPTATKADEDQARAAVREALKVRNEAEQAQPKMSVSIYEFDMDNHGNLVPNLNNIHRALCNPQSFGIQVRLDTFLDVITIRDGETWRPIGDVDYVRMRMALEAQKFKDVSHDKIRDSVMVMAEANKFDSAVEWLNSLEWDGVKRVDDFLAEYFGVAPSDYASACSRYIWTALAGRTLEAGCQADMALAFIGNQGLQKTKGLKAMVRDPELYVEID